MSKKVQALKMTEKVQVFETAELVAEHAKSQLVYYPFFRVPDLSMGVYVLHAGGIDTQKPHSEDEVYYVVSGRGQIKVDGKDCAVQPGSLIYVAARAEHKFHSIEEELTLLVFFAPEQYSRAIPGQDQQPS